MHSATVTKGRITRPRKPNAQHVTRPQRRSISCPGICVATSQNYCMCSSCQRCHFRVHIVCLRRLMFVNCELNHSEEECRCYANPGAAAQSLDELEFVRSACHAAQTGQLDKLERILRNRPEAVNSDGSTGAWLTSALRGAIRCWFCSSFIHQHSSWRL